MVELRAKEGKLVLFLDQACYHSAENCSSIWLHIEILVLCGRKGQKSNEESCISAACPGGNAWDKAEICRDLLSQTNGRACPQWPVQQSGPAITLELGTKSSSVQQLRQLGTAWGTDPEQHPRKGLRHGKGQQPLSQAPALGPESPGLAQLSLLRAGELPAHLPPSSLLHAGLAPAKLSCWWSPSISPWGTGGLGTPGEQPRFLSSLQLWLVWDEDEKAQI